MRGGSQDLLGEKGVQDLKSVIICFRSCDLLVVIPSDTDSNVI